MKNYNDCLDYLSKLDRDKIDLGLERVQKVGKSLDLLHFDCPVVMVAGTNGKGSVVKTLETIFSSAGYKVGAYTSPHIQKFNERIRFNNQDISDGDLDESFLFIEKNRENVLLTFFEFTTLSAFYYFKKMKPDLLILEVGLGGRLDAVNSVDADISVITSIDFDHMDQLGNTLEKIAFEKVHIARSQKPLIFMDKRIPDSVVKFVDDIDAKLIWAGRDYKIHRENNRWTWSSQKAVISALPMPQLKLQNVAGALMVVELLQSRFPVSEKLIRESVENTCLAGRFERAEKLGVFFDVSHNPAGTAWLARQLERQKCSGKKYAIFSMLSDKDVAAAITPLIPQFDVWLVCGLQHPRGQSAEEIAEILLMHQAKKWYTFPAVSDAFSYALAHYDPQKDFIVVFGSFVTVEQAKTFLSEGNQDGP